MEKQNNPYFEKFGVTADILEECISYIIDSTKHLISTHELVSRIYSMYTDIIDKIGSDIFNAYSEERIIMLVRFLKGIRQLKEVKLCSKTSMKLYRDLCSVLKQDNGTNADDKDKRIVLNNSIELMGYFDHEDGCIYVCPTAIKECAEEYDWDYSKLVEFVAYHELGHCITRDCFDIWTRQEMEQFANYFASYCLKNEIDDYIEKLSEEAGCICKAYADPLFYRHSEDDRKIESMLKRKEK